MPDNTAPADPMSALMEAAVQTHELYATFVKAGFSSDQAMQFVLVQWTEMVRHGLNGGAA